MKENILLHAGLGEEVIASMHKEKKIKDLAKIIEKMRNENLNSEEIARKIISKEKDERYYE
jgi:hypothetical protein